MLRTSPTRNLTGTTHGFPAEKSGLVTEEVTTHHTHTVNVEGTVTNQHNTQGRVGRGSHGQARPTNRPPASPDFPLTCPKLGGTEVRAALPDGQPESE
ncbi:hypothetical protein MRX96_033333 [Rhipicephalus microplus]